MHALLCVLSAIGLLGFGADALEQLDRFMNRRRS
jgi:hypothetical protein